MNQLTALKYNVDALSHAIEHDLDFFSPISMFVKRLKVTVDDNPSHVVKGEILFLAEKIERFFDQYRSTGETLYFPPSQISGNDDTVREIYQLAITLNGFDMYRFDELRTPTSEKSQPSKGSRKIDKSKIFIVHGHDNEAKETMAHLITTLGFDPIILHEQASSGKTIIEKIEAHTDVGFAVVLYTPCDKGGKDADAFDWKPRARQNVIFEHGYLIGKLGRDKVCALVRGGVELPNDIAGVVYIDVDKGGAWKYSLANELASAGYPADKNKIKS